MAQLDSFALNMRLLLGLLVFLAILFILVTAVWTAAKVWVFRVCCRRGQQEEHRRKHLPDGRPLPPAGPGICEGCQNAFQEVYYLPSGRRLCRTCFERCDEC